MSLEDALLSVVEEKIEAGGGEFRVDGFHDFELEVMTHDSLKGVTEGMKANEVFPVVQKTFLKLTTQGKIQVGGQND